MSTPEEVEANKALDRRIIEEVLNTGNVELFDELVAPQIAAHLKRDIPALRQAFPDLHYTIEDIVGENDRVVVRFTITGTNTGSFQGRPPTGKMVKWSGMELSRHAGGRIVEQWIVLDLFSLMKQLDIVPASIPEHSGISVVK